MRVQVESATLARVSAKADKDGDPFIRLVFDVEATADLSRLAMFVGKDVALTVESQQQTLFEVSPEKQGLN